MAAHLSTVQHLFSLNAQWARDVEKAEQGFFERSAEGQQPHTLWIGCSDSRVPESVITNSRPGDIFVHRNIANQFHLDDTSGLSVLAYAVGHLGVRHVVVVGHTECGGAVACLKAVQSPDYAETGPSQTIPSYSATDPLNRWLAPLTELVSTLKISSMPKSEALPIVVEANVKKQVENLCQTEIIKEKGKEVTVHGWVYDLSTGLLRDLEVSKSG